MVFLLRYHAAPTAAARNQSRRQHFAYEPIGNQLLQVQDFRREAGLRTDYAEHALFFGKSGKYLCLSQAVAEGPLAVNVLARGDRRLYHIKMMRHAHSDA